MSACIPPMRFGLRDAENVRGEFAGYRLFAQGQHAGIRRCGWLAQQHQAHAITLTHNPAQAQLIDTLSHSILYAWGNCRYQ